MSEEEQADPESIGKKAAGGFVWALVSFLLVQVGTFGTYTIASKIIGSEGIGVVATALTLVFWIEILLDLGMGASLIYEQEKGQSERVAVAFTTNIFVAVIVASLIFFAAPQIDQFFGAGNVAMFRVVAVLVLLKGLNQIPDSLLKRDMDFKRRARADFTRSLGRFIITVGLLSVGVGPIAMIIGVTTAEVAAVIVTWSLVRFKPVIRFNFKIATEMLKFGAAMFGARLVGMLWLNGDYLVISRTFGGKSKEFGDYFTAFRLPELILGSVYNIFSNVAFPAFSAARDAGEKKLVESSMKALRFLCLFGFPAGFGMSLIARDFITVWFGDDFVGAIQIMELLTIAGGFVAVGYASGDLYAAIGKPKLGLYFNLVFSPVLIVGFIFAVDHGVIAVALVHVLVIIPYSAFRIEVANRLLGTTWKESLIALRPALMASIGVVAFGLPVRLLLDAGFLSLFAIFFSGLIGAAVGLRVGDRSTLAEVGVGAGKLKEKVQGLRA